MREQRRNKMLLGLVGSVVAVAAVGSGWWLHTSNFVSTDNAYAAVEVAQVTPAVGGMVLEVLVKDTQVVKKGDALVRIDPTDAKLALAQAEAELAKAERRVRNYVANDGGLTAQIAAREAEQKSAAAQLTSAQADMGRATIDLQRRVALAKNGSVSGDELTQSAKRLCCSQGTLGFRAAAQAQAQANRNAAESAKQVNATLIEGTTAEARPEVLLAIAQRDRPGGSETDVAACTYGWRRGQAQRAGGAACGYWQH